MKKAISLLLALVLCLSLCACGGGESNTPNTPETTETPTDAAMDKNDSSNYIGTWETEHSRLTITKGGVGRYEMLTQNSGYYDLNWEVKDEVLITQISFMGMEHKAVLEISEDGASLSVLQLGFPSYVEGEDVFTKK